MTPDQKAFHAAAIIAALAPGGTRRSEVVDLLKRMGLSVDDADEVIAHAIDRGWAVEVKRFGERYLCAAPGPPVA